MKNKLNRPDDENVDSTSVVPAYLTDDVQDRVSNGIVKEIAMIETPEELLQLLERKSPEFLKICKCGGDLTSVFRIKMEMSSIFWCLAKKFGSKDQTVQVFLDIFKRHGCESDFSNAVIDDFKRFYSIFEILSK